MIYLAVYKNPYRLVEFVADSGEEAIEKHAHADTILWSPTGSMVVNGQKTEICGLHPPPELTCGVVE